MTLYVCRKNFEMFLGLDQQLLRDIRTQLLNRRDIQPRLMVINGLKHQQLRFENELEKTIAEQNLHDVAYLVATIGGPELEPASLRRSIIERLRASKLYYQLVVSYEDGLDTLASEALSMLKHLTGVEFMLHMTYFNASRTGLWHTDFVGEQEQARTEDERLKIVGTVSLNIPFQGSEKSYIEVKDESNIWSSSRYRDRAVFFNPRDSMHRVVVEEAAQRATMMFRTTELTVSQLRDALQKQWLLVEGEAR